jgi:hypothetical protein
MHTVWPGDVKRTGSGAARPTQRKEPEDPRLSALASPSKPRPRPKAAGGSRKHPPKPRRIPVGSDSDELVSEPEAPDDDAAPPPLRPLHARRRVAIMPKRYLRQT